MSGDIQTLGGGGAGGGSSPGTILNGTANGRLTLTSGVPITTTDVIGATTIYFTPYEGNVIGLYTGTVWQLVTFAENSLSLGTLSNANNYDVFGFLSSGTLAIELGQAWSTSTTRSVPLTLLNGVNVKATDATRRYLGTFFTTSATTTEDSVSKRFVFNQDQRVLRSLLRSESTATWTYTTNTIRQANGSASNQIQYTVGDQSVMVNAQLRAAHTNNSTIVSAQVGIGIDSTTAFSGLTALSANPSAGAPDALTAFYSGTPGLGMHTVTWLECSQAVGTATWYGTGVITGSLNTNCGISAQMQI